MQIILGRSPYRLSVSFARHSAVVLSQTTSDYDEIVS